MENNKLKEFEEKIDNLYFYLNESFFIYNLVDNLTSRNIPNNHELFFNRVYNFAYINLILSFYKIFEKGEYSLDEIIKYLKNNYKKINTEAKLDYEDKNKKDNIYNFKELKFEDICLIEKQIIDFCNTETFKDFKEVRDKRVAHYDKNIIKSKTVPNIKEIYDFIFGILNNLSGKILFKKYGDFIAIEESKRITDFLFSQLSFVEYIQSKIDKEEEKEKEGYSDEISLKLNLLELRKKFGFL